MALDDALEHALSELRFDDAKALLKPASDEDRSLWTERIERERRQALDQASLLATLINTHATRHEHLVLLDLDEDPKTAWQLALLSAATRERAETHLRGARNWAQGQRHANLRRLDETDAALKDFDIGLARSIVRRLEERFLDDEGRDRRDQLLLDIAARAMETEELADVAGQIWQESQPDAKPWWRRKRST